MAGEDGKRVTRMGKGAALGRKCLHSFSSASSFDGQEPGEVVVAVQLVEGLGCQLASEGQPSLLFGLVRLLTRPYPKQQSCNSQNGRQKCSTSQAPFPPAESSSKLGR